MYLLDAHALVWAIAAPESLPIRARKILSQEEVAASVVSYWELVLKKGRKTAPVAQPAVWWDRFVTRTAIEVIPVRVTHVERLDAMPELHRDPFDRMLLAQALVENYSLISRDAGLHRYGVPVVWR